MSINRVQPDTTLPKPKRIKTYTSLITQLGGTGIPTEIVLQDEIDGPITWTRTSAGLYKGTLTDAFVTDKTAITLQGTNSGTVVTIARQTDNEIEINTVFSTDGSASDGLLNKAKLEIKIYD